MCESLSIGMVLASLSCLIAGDEDYYCTVAIFNSIDCVKGNCKEVRLGKQVRNGVALRVFGRTWLIRNCIGTSTVDHTRQILRFEPDNRGNQTIAVQDICISIDIGWERAPTGFEFVELNSKLVDRIGLRPLEVNSALAIDLQVGDFGVVTAPHLLYPDRNGGFGIPEQPIEAGLFSFGEIDADVTCLAGVPLNERPVDTILSLLTSKPKDYLRGLLIFSKAEPTLALGLVTSELNHQGNNTDGVWTISSIYEFFRARKDFNK